MVKGQKPAPALGSLPPPPLGAGEALHWFANAFGACQGSARGLFLSDFTQEDLVTLESSVIRLKARGINPVMVAGDALYQQSEFLWQQAGSATTFGKPLGDEREAELAECQLVIVQELSAPSKPQHLWYLYHYLLYPRALAGLATVITTAFGYEEFIRLGSTCEDLEFGGRSVAWEKLLWLMEGSLINLPLFAQTRADGLPPMLQAEYFLWMSLRERELNVEPQYVLHDYMLDMAIVDGEKKLAIECEVLNQPGVAEQDPQQAKRNLMLLSEGWQLLRFSNREILNNYMDCAQGVEQVWQTGAKQTLVGHLTSGQTVVAQTVCSDKLQEDPFQQLATAHGGGPAVVFGGAGSGKTTCIAERVAYLIGHGVNPERILVLFYSPEIGKIIKSQLQSLVDKSVSERVQLYVWPDLGLKILKENPQAIKRKAPIKIEPNSQKVIERVLAKAKKDFDPTRLELSGDLDEFTAASFISLYKARLITPKQAKAAAAGVSEELMAKVYQAYEDQLLKANRIDRDDMVTAAVNCLIDKADLRARYQNQFDFVLVDEYQDATIAQDMLARLLAAPEDNLFFAGNENECIYESKGTTPDLLGKISLRLPRTRCYFLPSNWRCQPGIVDAANKLECAHMQPAALAPMVASRKDVLGGKAIVGPLKMESETTEADWVGGQIQELFKEGTSLKDIAVLYRYRRYGEVLEDVLTKHGVRFSATPRAETTLLPDEVGDMMAFLMLVVDPDGPKAKESFERACQLRTKEVDPKLSATIASFAEANNLSYLKAVEIYAEATADQSCRDLEQLMRVIRTMHKEALPPAETIALIRRTQRLGDYYSSVRLPASVKYEPLKKIFELEETAKQFKTVSEFVKSRQASKPKANTGDTSGDERVHLMTIREAKGLEFPVVFLVGLADGLFPAEGVADIKEERRLFYVGLTRAENQLYVSYPDAFEKFALKASPFLFESGLLSEAEAAAVAQPVAPAYKKISLDEPDDDSAAIAARSRTTPVPHVQPVADRALGVVTEQAEAGQANVSLPVGAQSGVQPDVAGAVVAPPVIAQPTVEQPASPESAKPIAAGVTGAPPTASPKPYLSQATVSALLKAQQEAVNQVRAKPPVVPAESGAGNETFVAEGAVQADAGSARPVPSPAVPVPAQASAVPESVSGVARALPAEFEPATQAQPASTQPASTQPATPTSLEAAPQAQPASTQPATPTSFEPPAQSPQAPTSTAIPAGLQSISVEPEAGAPPLRPRPGRALPASKTPVETTALEPESTPTQSEAAIWQEMTKGVLKEEQGQKADVAAAKIKALAAKQEAVKSLPVEIVAPDTEVVLLRTAEQEQVQSAPAAPSIGQPASSRQTADRTLSESAQAAGPVEAAIADLPPARSIAEQSAVDPPVSPAVPHEVIAEAQAGSANSISAAFSQREPAARQDFTAPPANLEPVLAPPANLPTDDAQQETFVPAEPTMPLVQTSDRPIEPVAEPLITAPKVKEAAEPQPPVALPLPAQLQPSIAEDQKITLVDQSPAIKASAGTASLSKSSVAAAAPCAPAPLVEPAIISEPLPLPETQLPAAPATNEGHGAFLAQCPHCFTALEPHARFCGGCGFKLPVHIPACARCHAPLPTNAKFCGECGLKTS